VVFGDERYSAFTTVLNYRNAFVLGVFKVLRPFKMSVFTSQNGAVQKPRRPKFSCSDSVFFSVSRPAVRPTGGGGGGVFYVRA
jgi:hypothetical protein